MRRYSIQTKIVLPFLLLFALVSIFVPLITVELFAWKYNEQFTRETQGWLNVIIETGFIREPIDKIKQTYSVEIMIFGKDYTLNASTLSTLPDAELNRTYLVEKLHLDKITQNLESTGVSHITRDVTLGGKPYKIFYHLVPFGRLYCLLRPMEQIAEARRTLTLYMLGIAILVIALVTLISHRIGKNLTDPIKDLVGFTEQVADGNLDEQCEVKTQDEIGDLTIAFNQMTQELKLSRNKLIQAERLATAGKMSASFAHEIRNPLSSMRMLSQMLLQKPELSNEHGKSLQYILDEIERIDTIVKGLMDFARPSSLNLDSHSLDTTLQSVLSLMEANLTHHQIELVTDYSPDIPDFQYDIEKLKQAFMNIVLNAMEAMPQGGTLTVSTFLQEDNVYIRVTDTGVGISAENIDKIFEPFFSLKKQGTGLGLANVKRVIEEHGGTVKIESTLDEGTSIFLYVPLRT